MDIEQSSVSCKLLAKRGIPGWHKHVKGSTGKSIKCSVSLEKLTGPCVILEGEDKRINKAKAESKKYKERTPRKRLSAINSGWDITYPFIGE